MVSFFSRSDSCFDSIALSCALSVGCQLNYSYGEDYVYANKRRQGGREVKNSDLLIDRDAGMGGDVDMAVAGEESDQDEKDLSAARSRRSTRRLRFTSMASIDRAR